MVTTPGTLLEAPVELAYSDHGPIELSRELLEPARETGHVLGAVAGWMLRPHERQVIDTDQIKRAAAHCDLPGPRTQARDRSTFNRRTGAWLHEPLRRLRIHRLDRLDADPAGGR